MNRFTGLSVRASNALFHMGLTNKDSIRKAIRRKTLHPSNVATRGYGWKTHREVLRYVGIDAPLSSVQIGKARAHCAGILRALGFKFKDISTILKLGSQEKARQLVARSQRLARTAKK